MKLVFLSAWLFFSASIVNSSIANTDNRVVVIPLGVAEAERLPPTAPVAARADTNVSDYIVNAITVIDKATQLIWQREDDNIRRTWEDALDYCISLELAGSDHWRLPNVNELLSIVDFDVGTPKIDVTTFPNTDSTLYWTSVPRARNSTSAWIVDFDDMRIRSNFKTNEFPVRCVR